MDAVLIVTVMVLVGMISLSAFFSASETAYSSLNQIRIKNLANEGVRHADVALENYENFDKILTTILIGNNIVNVASSTLCTSLFVEFMGEYGVLVATVFMITVILIFGEVTPKTLAKRNSERYALKFATTLRAVSIVLTPIIWAFLGLTHIIANRSKQEEEPTMTEEELYVMIDEIEEEGTLEKRESELIKSAIQFDDIKVSEINTPRVDIVAVDIRTEIEDMKRLFIESEYSRIPVYDSTIDHIIGAVYSKDFYARYVNGESFKLTDIIRPVKFVPESTSIATLLSDLQKTKIHIAVVLDNFGGTVGIVCLEDILEELVGDIWDENDEVAYPMVKEDDGTYTVLGEADLFDILEELGMQLEPTEDLPKGSSVSAFIHYKLEKIPKKGDKIDMDDFSIIVKSMKSRRIKEATLVIHPKAEEQSSE